MTITGMSLEKENSKSPEKVKEEDVEKDPKRGRTKVIKRKHKKQEKPGRKRWLSSSDNDRTLTSNFIKKYQDEDNCEFLDIKRLPEGFSDEVIDLEMQIDDMTFTIDTVNRLIFLYSQAIECYEGTDQARYKNYYKRLQNLVTKPTVYNSMKKPKPKQKKQDKNKENYDVMYTEKPVYRPAKQLPQDEEKKMKMDILLLEERNKVILQKYNQEEVEKSKLLESDIRSQSFNLEKRLARRKFTHNKILTRSNSSNLREKGYSIGVKDESSCEEYSSIMQNGDPKFEDSWNFESKMLLSNLNQQNMSQTLYSFTCEETICEEMEDEIY
jgi:hypothetical protein